MAEIEVKVHNAEAEWGGVKAGDTLYVRKVEVSDRGLYLRLSDDATAPAPETDPEGPLF